MLHFAWNCITHSRYVFYLFHHNQNLTSLLIFNTYHWIASNSLAGSETMKRRRSKYNDNVKEDRLSDLPNCVILHILSFLDTKHAVQTCILSKRWNNLWKNLPTLILNSLHFLPVFCVSYFVSSQCVYSTPRSWFWAPWYSGAPSAPTDCQICCFILCPAIKYQYQMWYSTFSNLLLFLSHFNFSQTCY